MATKQVPESRLSIRMEKAEIERLKAYAATKNKTLADWVREVVLVAAEVQDNKIAELERRIELLEAKQAA